MPKPWLRKGRGWFITIDGQQQFLSKNRREAFEQWHEIEVASKRQQVKDPLFVDLVDAYLEFAARQVRNKALTKTTLEDYVWYLDKFLPGREHLTASQVEPQVLTDWLNSKPTWGNAGQRGAITAVRRILSWAKKERRIADDPLDGFEKPRQNRRDNLISQSLHEEMIRTVRESKFASTADKQFQLVIISLLHCGGRPQDIANARVEHVDTDVTCWTIPEHKRYRHTAKPKIIVLSPCLATITKMLIQGRKEGPLFRGRAGALSVNAIGCRVKRIQKKIGSEVIAYDFRHTYITDALQAGVDIATVAELAGTSVQMIEKHYGHIGQRREHLEKSTAAVARLRRKE